MKTILGIRDYARFTMLIGLVLLVFGGSVFILTALLQLLITGDINE